MHSTTSSDKETRPATPSTAHCQDCEDLCISADVVFHGTIDLRDSMVGIRLTVCHRSTTISLHLLLYFVRRIRSSPTPTTDLLLDMTRPRGASSHGPAYIQGSPIGQLWTWATKFKGPSDEKGCRPKPSSPDNENESGRYAVIPGLSIETSKSAHGDGHPVEVPRSELREACGHERHSEAHDWGFARRIVVAGIICWYT